MLSASSAGLLPISVSVLSPKAQDYYARVKKFIKDHVMPLEQELIQHQDTPEKWSVHPKIEELKVGNRDFQHRQISRPYDISLSILRMTSSFCVVWAISDMAFGYGIYARIVFHAELYFMREAVRMIWGSNLCLSGDQWWCSAWSWVRIFVFLESMVVLQHTITKKQNLTF
jgi:hypothetical protein